MSLSIYWAVNKVKLIRCAKMCGSRWYFTTCLFSFEICMFVSHNLRVSYSIPIKTEYSCNWSWHLFACRMGKVLDLNNSWIPCSSTINGWYRDWWTVISSNFKFWPECPLFLKKITEPFSSETKSVFAYLGSPNFLQSRLCGVISVSFNSFGNKTKKLILRLQIWCLIDLIQLKINCPSRQKTFENLQKTSSNDFTNLPVWYQFHVYG